MGITAGLITVIFGLMRTGYVSIITAAAQESPNAFGNALGSGLSIDLFDAVAEKDNGSNLLLSVCRILFHGERLEARRCSGFEYFLPILQRVPNLFGFFFASVDGLYLVWQSLDR